MKKKVVVTAAALISSIGMLGAQATDYSFPTGMTVSIEKDAVPSFKDGSNVVYSVVNYFTVTMPNGDEEFSLRTEAGDDLAVIKQGDRYFINSHIPLGEHIYFGPDIQNVANPVRVMIDGPINVGHVHFLSGSSTLTAVAKKALALMAKEMADSNLTSAYLVGMTDINGDDQSNVLLSEKRASKAALYLEKKLDALGITDAVITTEGMGEYLADQNNGSVNGFDRKVSVLIFPTIK
jgi:outer membrane protein OmpA-like peptidoglycan-associated protein